MKKKLTSRQKSIIQILVKSTINNPVTILKIAEKLELSSRTVLREMPKVEEWLHENEFKFIKKPGVGLVIDENLESRQFILELLDMENVEKDYSKEQRKKMILIELLSAKEPLKLFYFTSKLNVSEGTISNDLDNVEDWLKTFNISMIRKPGLGIYIEGKENNYREAIVNILYDNLEENKIIELLRGTVEDSKNKKLELAIENRLLNFIDKTISNNIENVLSNLENEFHVKFADSAYIGLIVHLSLVIQRIKNNENIVMDKESLEKLMILPEFKIGQKIVKGLEEIFKIKIPKDEIGYITMHLKGARLRLSKISNEFENNLSNLDIKQVASYIINKIEEEFNVNISGNGNLIKDLTNHLGPAISRLTMKLNIRNPLLKDIKQNYSEIYTACENACDILKDITGSLKIPESEIAYITMHIAAALEKNIKSEKVAVVTVCPTGVGTSKLLAANIENEFDNVEVKSTISALNINEDELRENEIDLIISTIGLNINYKYVCVSPILSDQDKELLKHTINNISKKKKYTRIINNNKVNNNCDKNEIKEITELGLEITELLSEVKLIEINSIDSVKQLIKQASAIFAKNEEEAIIIEGSLIRREEIASTYLHEINAMLLHCKSENVSRCKFGAIRMNKEFTENEKYIRIGILMLIPINPTKIQLNMMGEISGALIESKSLINILKNGDKNEINRQLEEILSTFYRKYLKNKMEEWNND